MPITGSQVVFEHQADATLSQNNPGDGTKYTVLATTRNVRIIGISVQCSWTVQPTPLEIHLTIDGQTLTFGQSNPVSATPYYPRTLMGIAQLANDSLMMTGSAQDISFLLEGRSVKVEVEITGGTVSNLSARVKYARLS